LFTHSFPPLALALVAFTSVHTYCPSLVQGSPSFMFEKEEQDAMQMQSPFGKVIQCPSRQFFGALLSQAPPRESPL
jgi:hypothetical protein